MKKNVLAVGVCMITAFLLFGCFSAPPQQASSNFQGADVSNGVALNIGYGVTITTFDGEEVNWRAESSLVNKESKRVYVPAGGHKFVAQYGIKTKQFEENFVAGSTYLVDLLPGTTTIYFEKLR